MDHYNTDTSLRNTDTSTQVHLCLEYYSLHSHHASSLTSFRYQFKHPPWSFPDASSIRCPCTTSAVKIIMEKIEGIGESRHLVLTPASFCSSTLRTLTVRFIFPQAKKLEDSFLQKLTKPRKDTWILNNWEGYNEMAQQGHRV